LPSVFALGGVWPNPMRWAGHVEYTLPVAARVRLSVADLMGREVAVLVNGMVSEGRHVASIDARSLALNPGIYFLRYQTPRGRINQRIALVR